MMVSGTITSCSTELRPLASYDVDHNATTVNWLYFERKSFVVQIMMVMKNISKKTNQ